MNILFIRVSAIGDVVHTLPAVFLIKKTYPNANISWVVQEKAAQLLIGQPFLDNVWVLPDKFLYPKQWHKTYEIVKEMRQTSWDAIIDFQGLFKTSFLYFWLKGPVYGFGQKNVRERVSLLFTHKKHQPIYQNIIQKNLSLASFVLQDVCRSIFCPTNDSIQKMCYLSFPVYSKNMVDLWLNKRSIVNYIVIAPNTTWQSKLWPESCWRELLYLLHDKNDVSVPIVLVGSAFGGQAHELARFVEKNNFDGIFVVPSWDLLTTAYLIKKASLVLAPDTGLLHMADFLGTQAIGIFGPTKAERHGPFWVYDNKKNVFQVSCPHDYQKTHGSDTKNSCMFKLTPEMVYTRIRNCIEGIL
ncbi:MAG: glycosyltransferase family 9 protein [bacterium]